MLSCDFSPQILDVPPAPLLSVVRCGALILNKAAPLALKGAAPIGGKLAKIKLRVQRRKRPKKPISASI
jgi:hypothetical protein